MSRLCCAAMALALALAGCESASSREPAPSEIRIARQTVGDGAYEIVLENPGATPVRGVCHARFYDSEGRRVIRGRDPRARFELAPGESVVFRGAVPLPGACRVEARVQEEMP